MRVVLVTLACLLSATAAVAQTPESSESGPIDEIVVQGKLRGGDKAMSAFFNGDFETAEIEFERNIRIIKRGETEIEQAATTAITQNLAEIGGQVVTAGSRGVGGQVQSAPSLSTAPTGLQANNPEGLVTSGKDMGFQFYMAGLSELQLGKVDEAEDSLQSAVHHNGRLYDARMRLALIRLGKGDVDFAKRQLSRLEKDSKRCKARCDRSEELRDSEVMLREFLAQYL